MLDIAIIKSAVDLFKELLTLVDRRNQNRREVFERTCKPLFDRLEVIAKEYYSIISALASRLAEPNADFDLVLRDVKAGRARLVIARNGIIGEAEAFERRYGDEESPKKTGKGGKFESLAVSFANGISDYFYANDRLFVPTGKTTQISGLIMKLEEFIRLRRERPAKSEKKIADLLKGLTNEAASTLEQLEANWTELTERYTELKLYADA